MWGCFVLCFFLGGAFFHRYLEALSEPFFHDTCVVLLIVVFAWWVVVGWLVGG